MWFIYCRTFSFMPTKTFPSTHLCVFGKPAACRKVDSINGRNIISSSTRSSSIRSSHRFSYSWSTGCSYAVYLDNALFFRKWRPSMHDTSSNEKNNSKRKPFNSFSLHSSLFSPFHHDTFWPWSMPSQRISARHRWCLSTSTWTWTPFFASWKWVTIRWIWCLPSWGENEESESGVIVDFPFSF